MYTMSYLNASKIKKFLGILFLAIFFFVLIAGLSARRDTMRETHAGTAIVGGVELQIEFAKTDEARSAGLSKYAEIADDFGMVFVFERPGKHGFWMKDMHFPIDIVWIGQDMAIVHIERGVSPDSYPSIFRPSADAAYVLETKAGFSQKQNLKIGDRIFFSE